ncbi:MAG: nuclear transport factor 2 family protein [Paracoccaceae bacterium]|nr:nuclear transport factor 2 family protein [Paracoccaceae bacterium]MDG2257646.1 nuclear transport factor 2 family protein [Paracoccaceae bacterium]
MTELTRDLADAVGDAFNAMDIDAVMQYFAEDCIFDHAVGPEPCGVRLEGLETIRGAFQGLFNKVENVHWETLDCRISGDKAYCEYRKTVAHKDGSAEDYHSVDILTFREGLIVHKDTYFKQRTS